MFNNNNNKMITTQEIKNAIKNKGYKTQFIKAEDTKDGLANMIGFTSNGNVWFWFKQIVFSNGDEITNFDHKYNCLNGNVIKSFRQEQKAFNLLGVKF